jgi:hypothetical protein
MDITFMMMIDLDDCHDAALAAFLSWQFNSKCIDSRSVLTNRTEREIHTVII